MEKQKIVEYFNKFIQEYKAENRSFVWERQSEIFHNFWKNKILNDSVSKISEQDIDLIVVMLDCKARGTRKFREMGGESVAATSVKQPVWHKMFTDLKEQKIIQQILNNILNADDDKTKIELINKLQEVNLTNKNGLTGEQGCALNALLFTFNPGSYITAVSLRHRLAIINRFGLGKMDNYDNYSYGEKIIKTNNFIIDGFKEKYGIIASPHALSCFFYGVEEINEVFWTNRTGKGRN